MEQLNRLKEVLKRRYPRARARKMGSSIDEIVEVLEIAVVMGGGPSLAYGVKAYKAAKELLRV